MTSCMELWFPTSAPASHRRHFFLLRSLSLALFLLISSRIVLLFLFIFYFYFFYTYRGVIMRQRWSNFVASRLLRNWSRRTTLPPPSRSVIFKNYCSLRVLQCNGAKTMWNTRFLLSLLFNDIAFVSFFFLLFLRFFLMLCCNWFDTLRICDEMFRLDSKEEVFLE